jgi:hypothetical protein
VLPTRTEAGHWIEHYFPIKDGSETVQRIAVVVIEITEQKKLERLLQDVGGRLRKEMDRLQMLLDVSTIVASNWNLHEAFPRISARIRRVLRHEYAGFELYDANTGPIPGFWSAKSKTSRWAKDYFCLSPSAHSTVPEAALCRRAPL